MNSIQRTASKRNLWRWWRPKCFVLCYLFCCDGDDDNDAAAAGAAADDADADDTCTHLNSVTIFCFIKKMSAALAQCLHATAETWFKFVVNYSLRLQQAPRDFFRLLSFTRHAQKRNEVTFLFVLKTAWRHTAITRVPFLLRLPHRCGRKERARVGNGKIYWSKHFWNLCTQRGFRLHFHQNGTVLLLLPCYCTRSCSQSCCICTHKHERRKNAKSYSPSLSSSFAHAHFIIIYPFLLFFCNFFFFGFGFFALQACVCAMRERSICSRSLKHFFFRSICIHGALRAVETKVK